MCKRMKVHTHTDSYHTPNCNLLHCFFGALWHQDVEVCASSPSWPARSIARYSTCGMCDRCACSRSALRGASEHQGAQAILALLNQLSENCRQLVYHDVCVQHVTDESIVAVVQAQTEDAGGDADDENDRRGVNGGRCRRKPRKRRRPLQVRQSARRRSLRG